MKTRKTPNHQTKIHIHTYREKINENTANKTMMVNRMIDYLFMKKTYSSRWPLLMELEKRNE